MTLLRCASIACLVLSSAAVAQPAPVNPVASTTCRPGTNDAQIALVQDRCFTWSAPAVNREGNLFRITQTVAPLPTCASPGNTLLNVSLGQIPIGQYQYAYEASPAGTLPRQTGDFAVRACAPAELAISPAAPVALEPVRAYFNLIDTCQFVTGVRPENGGFTITVKTETDNSFDCDAIVPGQVTIGAFPPGHYIVRLARPPAEGGQVYATAEFDVSPDVIAPRPRNQLSDFSGVWTNADQQPSTAIDFINSFDRISPTQSTGGLSGIWYFYDTAGRPVWYFIEANNSASTFGRVFRGIVTSYSATNPSSPDFLRTVAGTRVGDIAVSFGEVDQPGLVVATINGVRKEFQIQRFRWTRAAWPPAN